MKSRKSENRFRISNNSRCGRRISIMCSRQENTEKISTGIQEILSLKNRLKSGIIFVQNKTETEDFLGAYT